MHILDVNSVVGSTVEGSKGSLTAMNAIDEPLFGTRVIIVPPLVKAPKQGVRLAHRTMLFALQGSATLSNGEYYQKITPGRLVMLDAGEECCFQTEKEKFVCLEVRIGPSAPPAPETAQTLAFVAVEPPASEAPKRSQAVYDEI